jgi:hypothetical protein
MNACKELGKSLKILREAKGMSSQVSKNQALSS